MVAPPAAAVSGGSGACAEALGMGRGGGLRRDLPRRALRGAHPSRARLGRLDDLGGPGPLRPPRGDGRCRRADAERLVRQPPLVPAAAAGGAGGRAGDGAGGLGRSRLPAAVRRLLPRLAAGGLRRRAGAGGPRRRRLDDADRRPAPLSGLRAAGRRGLGLRRPAARLLLRRRPRAAPGAAVAPVGGPRGGPPPGGCRPRQGRRRGARAGGARLRRALFLLTLAAPLAAARAGGPAARPRPDPALLLAGRRSRALRELREDRLLVAAVAGAPHPRAAPRRLGRPGDEELR